MLVHSRREEKEIVENTFVVRWFPNVISQKHYLYLPTLAPVTIRFIGTIDTLSYS